MQRLELAVLNKFGHDIIQGGSSIMNVFLIGVCRWLRSPIVYIEATSYYSCDFLLGYEM